MRLDTLKEHHYRALYEIHKRAERFNVPDYMTFHGIMEKREGFVVIAPNGEIAGCISFSDYIPEMDIVIFCFIDPQYRGRWALKRGMYRTVFDYTFKTLELPRVTGYTVKPINDDAAGFLAALGFKHEGTVRKRVKMPDNEYYDIEIYGLLKEERRW